MNSSVNDLGVWLTQIGLSEYASIFAQNDINSRAVQLLSDQDLQDLGFSLGHRRIFFDAIAQLRENDQTKEAAEAQRRQLTVLFCDLAGSSALSERFDAEDVREMIQAYRRACIPPIQRFGGFVQRFIGDGILAFFGYPQAHEDDGERAIRAGLGILESMEGLNRDAGHKHGVNLRVRIGIATGPVVVGDIGAEANLERNAVIGGAANLAARLQDRAEPDSIVVDPETRVLASRHFEYRDLGEQALKGFGRKIAISQVVSERHGQEPDWNQSSGPLINRDREMTLLLDLWRRAETGRGQVAIICGKAGVGKSRVALALHDRITACVPGSGVMIALRCSPHHRNVVLHPIIRKLLQLAQIEGAEPTHAKLAKLGKLSALLSWDLLDFHLIADLLGIDGGATVEGLAIGPREKRQRTLEVLERWISAISLQKPLLLLFEDAQWLDPTSKLFMSRTRRAVCRSPYAHLGDVAHGTRRSGAVGPHIGRAMVASIPCQYLSTLGF